MDSFFVKPGSNKRQKPERSSNGQFGRPPSQASGFRGRSQGAPQRGTRERGQRGAGRSARGGRQNGATENGFGPVKEGKKRFRAEDEEILSDDSDVGEAEDQIVLQRDAEEKSDDEETAQDKRLRLTKDYLQQLAATTDDDGDVADKLRDEILESAGRLRRPVAAQFVGHDASAVKKLRGHSGHKLSVTCVASDGTVVFSGGKEGTLIKWDVATGKMLKKILLDKTAELGHSAAILTLALSSDSKYLASGSADKNIKIWKASTVDLYFIFKGHRDAVSGVVFRNSSHQLFSCGHDRNVKVWNVDEKAYVETLFGHQNAVTGIDSYHKERCITSGGQDASVRIWKILEESQLVFQLPTGSIECLSLIDDDHFVTGGDDGSVALWGAQKKKPMYTIRQAHIGPAGEACWVSSIDALKNSDIFASGSQSREIKVWMIQDGFRAILPHFSIPVVGFVNSIKFVADGSVLIAGVGQEHRMGRWWRLPGAKNSVCVFPLKRVVEEIER